MKKIQIVKKRITAIKKSDKDKELGITIKKNLETIRAKKGKLIG